MMSNIELPFFLLSMMLFGGLLLLLSALILLFCHLMLRRSWLGVMNNLVLTAAADLLHSLLRDVYLHRYKSEDWTLWMPGFASAPAWTSILPMVGLSLWLLWSVWDYLHLRRVQITPMSVKEGFDRMPVGICYCSEDGLPILVNEAMNRLAGELTGKTLTDGQEFCQALKEGKLAAGCEILVKGEHPVIQTAEGQVYALHSGRIAYGDGELNELFLSDVTEEYAIIKRLEMDKEKMTQLNLRLRDYSRSMADAAIEKEILAAKVRIHDELGHALIVAKRYLTTGEGNKQDILSLWKKNVTLLKEERHEPRTADYARMFDNAEQMGVKICLEGQLPTQPMQRYLTVTAISECVTNTCRHAGGDTIFLSVEENDSEMTLRISNNGRVPDAEIVEGSGLTALRQLTEYVGGHIQICSLPKFVLTLRLPKEEQE